MPSVTVHLSPDEERFLESRIASGRYVSAGDAIREGLKLLQTREEQRDAALAEIRREIAIGLEQARAGQLIDADEVFDQLEAELGLDDAAA